jgi:hypothetical protein
MPSVSEALRRDTAERISRLSIHERIALALSLGDDDLALYVRATGKPPHVAARELHARHGRGRTPSRSAAPDR